MYKNFQPTLLDLENFNYIQGKEWAGGSVMGDFC